MATMDGHLRERRPGVWEAIVFLGRDTAGRQRFTSTTVHGTRADGQAALHRLLVEVDEGRRVAAKGTLADLVERWYVASCPGWTDSTRRLHRRLLDGHLLPALGHVQLRRLRPSDIDRWYAQLVAKGLASTTRTRIDALLRRALDQAVRWDELGRNPADRASNRPVPKAAPIDPPTADQVRKLLAAAEERDPDFAVFLRLSAGTGGRRGELAALRWDDVDLDRGLVRITKAAEPNGSAGRTKSTKSGGRRQVVVDPVTAQVLRDHHDRLAARAAAVDMPAGPWLFTADVAGRVPWHPATVTHRFIRLARAAGVRARLHDIRHFHATQLLDSGVPVIAVSRRLGHARSSTTLDTYGHWIPDSDDGGAGTIGSILDG